MTMQYTPLFNLPYPQSSDSSDTWEYWQQLATAIENAWTPKVVDAPITWATDFTDQGATAVYTCGPWVFLNMYATYTGAGLTANADGALTDKPIGTLAAALFPPLAVSVLIKTTSAHGSGYVSSTGSLVLASMAGTYQLKTGQSVAFTTVYPLAKTITGA